MNERRKGDRRIPPAVAQHMVEERGELLARIAELEAHAKRLGQGDADLKAQQSSNCLAAQVLKAQEAITQWPPELRKGLRIPDFTEWLATDKPSAGQWPKQECPVTGAVTDVDPADMGGQPSANLEHTLFNEIRISEPVHEDGELKGYLINEQQLQRIRLLEFQQPSAGVVDERAEFEAEYNKACNAPTGREVALRMWKAGIKAGARLNPCRAQSVPDGYALVPVEPTRRMCDAGYNSACSHAYMSCYRAMIAAAPSAKKEG